MSSTARPGFERRPPLAVLGPSPLALILFEAATEVRGGNVRKHKSRAVPARSSSPHSRAAQTAPRTGKPAATSNTPPGKNDYWSDSKLRQAAQRPTLQGLCQRPDASARVGKGRGRREGQPLMSRTRRGRDGRGGDWAEAASARPARACAARERARKPRARALLAFPRRGGGERSEVRHEALRAGSGGARAPVSEQGGGRDREVRRGWGRTAGPGGVGGEEARGARGAGHAAPWGRAAWGGPEPWGPAPPRPDAPRPLGGPAGS